MSYCFDVVLVVVLLKSPRSPGLLISVITMSSKRAGPSRSRTPT